MKSTFLFSKKSVAEIKAEAFDTKHPMKRVLGPFHLTALGVGAIIGVGIFVLTGQAAAQYAGPAIVISFLISGTASAFAGLCYAEFASTMPVAGSAYTYAYATLGELLAWIIGWDLMLEYLFAASTVAVGWSGYVTSFLRDFGIAVPGHFSAAPLNYTLEKGWEFTGAIINFPAVFIVSFITTLLVLGIRESARFNNVIVVLKVCVIILFIGFGIAYIRPENWTPFIPENTGRFGQYGISGIIRGAGVVFLAYIGFDAVTTAGQESRNPQRDMPIGILVSLSICAFLYILVALVLTGLVKYNRLLVPDPMSVAIDAAGPGLLWLRPLISGGAVAALTSVILVMLLGQSRVLYRMAEDGLLPSKLAKIHSRYRTPYFATILTGAFAAVIAGILPVGILGELVSIGTLLAFTIVCLGTLVLRKTHPQLPRPFKTPFVPVVPVLGALFSLIQMSFLPEGTWFRLVIWMGIGLIIYFSYSRRHSVVRQQMGNAKKELIRSTRQT